MPCANLSLKVREQPAATIAAFVGLPRGSSLRIIFLTIAALAAAAVAATASPPASARGPLVTALSYTGMPADAKLAHVNLVYSRVRASGATVYRSTLYWWQVVGRTPPRNPANPRDRAYNWRGFDTEIRNVVRHGLTPVVAIYGSPTWARTGDKQYASAPDPAAWAAFAKAAARRYSGAYRGVPRVRFWQAWLEPNLNSKFRPQFDGRTPVSPRRYRELVNVFWSSVKSVRRDNVVIAGGTSPFSDFDPGVREITKTWGPLTFMRHLLCLSRSLKPTCREKIRFDVWAHHPYTSGGPGHRARNRLDDASLGDLPYMNRVLATAYRRGVVVSRGKPRFWVTEFSWDSAPPDPEAVPMPLLRRWIAHGLYDMWRAGVSLVTWLTLRDNPPNDFVQAGLWFRGANVAQDRPKPIIQAFRFPVVAFRAGNRIRVWGRTPWGRRGRVVVEQSFRGGWRQLGTVPTTRYGIFERYFRTSRAGSVRARLEGRRETSDPFSLKPVRDRFIQPFGTHFCGEPPCRQGSR